MKNILFVDDEPRVLHGLERQLHKMAGEWQMSFVDGGAKALELMGRSRVDVVVTDMMMPEMDGAQLLNEVVLRHPQVIRIVLSGQTETEGILRLVCSAHQYLSKPCGVEELRAAITSAFALQEMLSSRQLKELTARIKSLPVLPELYTQLTAELRKEETSPDRVAEIISKDIGMVSKIFHLVNSAFFGLPRRINNANEAVCYLGLATIRSLVLSIQVFSRFQNKKMAGFSMDALTSHCWTTAVLARKMAILEQCDAKTQDNCFLAGFLHDIGQLVLAAEMPEEYGRVLEKAREGNKKLWEAELEAFGATHAEVGAYLLGLWKMPTPIIEAVWLHHRPEGIVTPGFSPAVAVHFADGFAHARAGTHFEWPENQVDVSCLARLGLEGRLGEWKENCLGE
jgi:HD-like signal output (HDOD) protein/CheY-like chemotaxis protein